MTISFVYRKRVFRFWDRYHLKFYKKSLKDIEKECYQGSGNHSNSSFDVSFELPQEIAGNSTLKCSNSKNMKPEDVSSLLVDESMANLLSKLNL